MPDDSPSPSAPPLEFRLRRPRYPPDPRYSGPADRRIRQTSLLLIASSHEDAKGLCAEQLRIAGFQVVMALDGSDALHMARAVRPSLIFIDTWHDGLTRLGPLRRLRQDPATAHIPVAALTRWSRDEERAAMLGHGFDAVLPKPCQPEDILLYVLNKLRLHHPQQS